MKIKRIITLIFMLLLASCSIESNSSSWLNTRIVAIEDNLDDSCIGEIWRYDYNDGVVYFFISNYCKDAFNILYNSIGFEIGSQGGIAGTSSGVISNFYENRTNGEQIWRRPGEW